MQSLSLVDGWDVPQVSVAVVNADGIEAARGPLDHEYRIASLAKLLTAFCALVAVEEGTITLDEPAARPGATVRHLLAHAAGYGFDGDEPIAPVGARRIYSNPGIERFAHHLGERADMPFADYFADVTRSLGLGSTALRGSPAHAMWSTLGDLCRFAAELLAPRAVAASTLAEAVRVQFAGLSGILPSVGRFSPLDWGLGFERNFAKPGHWAGVAVSAETFGHFGGAGTFLFVDPSINRAVVCLTDREFGPWAMKAWPPFCDAVVAECRETGA